MLFCIRMLLVLQSFGRFSNAGDVIFDLLYHISHNSPLRYLSDLLILILSVEKMGWKAWVAHPGSQGLIVVGQD